MTTVQHPSKSTDWWEDQAIVENSLKHLLLILESLCFFLFSPSEKKKTRMTLHYSYLIDRSKVRSVIDRIFLILTALNCDSIEIVTI